MASSPTLSGEVFLDAVSAPLADAACFPLAHLAYFAFINLPAIFLAILISTTSLEAF